MAAQLPPARLVRTITRPSDGVSVIASDATTESFLPFGPRGSGFSVFDVREAVPARNDVVPDDAASPFARTLPRCPPRGAIFCLTDIPAGGAGAPMHRTTSIDYAVILAGELDLELDGGQGETRTLRVGDCIVQQGANHRWVNRGQGPCRMWCVMLGAEAMVLRDGTVLEATVFGKK